ncbi:MAG TPA: 16S rRNA processing protein RimM, partial [Methylothermaceae bacterium]|nr:16S rRNA processing protein RimM [Methylothermaceae bacterium]
GIDTRDQAEALKGAQISIAREQLPDLPPGEYYWTDLIGLRVIDTEGRDLGQVANLLETGANDVLIVRGAGRREILIPWIRDRVIRKVDLAAGRIEVDWDPDY